MFNMARRVIISTVSKSSSQQYVCEEAAVYCQIPQHSAPPPSPEKGSELGKPSQILKLVLLDIDRSPLTPRTFRHLRVVSC